MNKKSYFIMGLPAAGKTTYLAALAYATKQTDKIKLQWKTFSGNNQYINDLSHSWLSGTVVSRTSLANQQLSISVELIDSDAGTTYGISFPDISGELFQNQYVYREMEDDYSTLLKQCDVVLLFVNPDNVISPQFITELPERFRNEDSPIMRKLQSDPTEVQLVELMQFVNYIRDDISTPITIVVSAWDRVEVDYRKPEEYVKNNLPLLWQYIVANSNVFIAQYFGISAQGGPINSEEDAEQLIEKYENPIDRIKVVNNNGAVFHDPSIILWSGMQEG